MPFRLGAVAFFPLVLPMLRSLLGMLSAVMQPAFCESKLAITTQSMLKGGISMDILEVKGGISMEYLWVSCHSLMKAFVKSSGSFVQACVFCKFKCQEKTLFLVCCWPQLKAYAANKSSKLGYTLLICKVCHPYEHAEMPWEASSIFSVCPWGEAKHPKLLRIWQPKRISSEEVTKKSLLSYGSNIATHVALHSCNGVAGAGTPHQTWLAFTICSAQWSAPERRCPK